MESLLALIGFPQIILNTRVAAKLLILLQKITSKIEKLQYEINNKIYNGIVFGGKKLFKEQFKENINFDTWQEKWHNRGNEFECGGSKSENYGNQQFQLKFSKTIRNKHYFDLHVNVPYQLREKYGSVYVLKNIYFPRGNDILKQNHDNNVAYFKDLNKNNFPYWFDDNIIKYFW